MMYLPLFIKRNAFDGICHEHPEYYSLFSLEYLLNKYGLKIVGLDIRKDINEGSERFFIKKKDFSNKLKLKSNLIKNLIEFRNKELLLNLDDINIYNKMKKNI